MERRSDVPHYLIHKGHHPLVRGAAVNVISHAAGIDQSLLSVKIRARQFNRLVGNMKVVVQEERDGGVVLSDQSHCLQKAEL